jgi:hypothetical protein
MVTTSLSGCHRLSAAFGLLIAASAGCTFPEKQIAPGERHLVVHAVLDPGTRDQKILLSYTDGAVIGPVTGVPQVSITTPDDVQMFAVPDSQRGVVDTTLRPNGGYRIPLDAYGVTLVPGATYTLHVHMPAGDDATGTTTIPLASGVAVPIAAEPFDRLRDSVRLSWPTISGAESYEILVLRDSTGVRDGLPPIVKYDAFTTRALTFAGTAHSAHSPFDDADMFDRQFQTIVLVSAVDINYYQYYRVLSDPLSAAAPSRLTGALGVFGSVVPIVARRLDVK